MAERKDRPVYDGAKRVASDRRIAQRRKSDKVKTFLQYLAVAVIVALMVKLLG